MSLNICAQSFDLRKLILKSDLIFASEVSNYKDSSIIINDFTTENLFIINKIDTLLKGNLPLKKKLIIQNIKENEDYFSIQNSTCIKLIPPIIEDNIQYYTIFFCKKSGNSYKVLGKSEHVNIPSCRPFCDDGISSDIRTLLEIEKTKTIQDRYNKTIDWYIEKGKMPAEDFIKFYKEKRIIKDSIILTDKQALEAYVQFKDGCESLEPLVAAKYKDEIKQHYMDKLYQIGTYSIGNFDDCREFQKTINKLTNNFDYDFQNPYYLLNELLTNSENDYKKEIMKVLMEFVRDKFNQ